MDLNLRVKTKAKTREGLKNEEEELEPLSPTSESFGESACILCIFESEIPSDVTAVSNFIKNVFVQASPRLTSIIVEVEDKKGRKMWKKVDIDIGDHIKIPTFPEGLSSENYTQHFDDYISRIAKEQLSQDRPLWEAHIFAYPTSRAPATMILKIHHAIGDGFTLMGIVFSCFQRADDPSLPLTFPSLKSTNQRRRTNGFKKILSIVPKFVSSMLFSFYDFGQNISNTVFEDDRTPIRSGDAGPHSIRHCTLTFSLDDVKRIKSSLGVTVNDVIVGTIFLGIHLYMQAKNYNPRSKMARSTALIAVNLRMAKGYAQIHEMQKENSKVPWGNKITLIRLPVPTFDQNATANPVKFVRKAHKVIKRKRTSFAPYLELALLSVVKAIAGKKVVARAFQKGFENSSLVITNLIGPLEQMTLASHPISGFYFMVTGFRMGLSVCVMSYKQNIRVCLAVEEDFIDQQTLLTCVENAFKLIFQAATSAKNCSR